MNYKILVADDDTELLELIDTILAANNCEVLTTESSLNIMNLLIHNDFDFAVFDLIMPGMNTSELLYQIKKYYPKLGIIIMTANPSIGSKIETLRDGVIAYIAKPFDPKELISIFTKYQRR